MLGVARAWPGAVPRAAGGGGGLGVPGVRRGVGRGERRGVGRTRVAPEALAVLDAKCNAEVAAPPRVAAQARRLADACASVDDFSHSIVMNLESSMGGCRALAAKAIPSTALGAAGLREALAEDIEDSVLLYGSLVGEHVVRATLTKASAATCSRWHVDHVRLRGLRFFVGPGSEFIKPGSSLTAGLVSRASSRGGNVLADTLKRFIRRKHVVQATEGSLLWLKGSEWEGNRHNAVVHRSPAHLGDRGFRLFLTLDCMRPAPPTTHQHV